MASHRSMSESSAWLGVVRPGDRGAYFESSGGEIRPGLTSQTRRAPEPSRQPGRTIPQPKMSSKSTHLTSQRRLSDVQPGRPLFDRQLSSGSSRSGSLGIPTTDAPVLTASATSRLPAPSTRRRNVLRRKQSGLSKEPKSIRSESLDDSSRDSPSSSSNIRSQTPLEVPNGPHFDRHLTQSPMEIRGAQRIEVLKTTAQTVTLYPELDRYRDVVPLALAESPSREVPYPIDTYDLPPPTPLFSGTSSQISGFSGSPSTRFSESPGPSPYSRDTTPTSISSQSPSLVAPLRIPAPATRTRQVESALTRPPITRRRTGSISNEVGSLSADPHGLASVRESLTSSSSNSTVRDGDRKDKKKKRLSPLPPSPPPRKSSHKFTGSRDEKESPSKSARVPAQPLMTSPPTAKATSSTRPRPVQASRPVAPSKATPPLRPSRDGTPDLQSQLGLPLPIIHSNLSSTSLSERRQSSSLVAPRPVGRVANSSSLPDRQNQALRRPSGREPTPAPKSAVSGEVMSKSKPEPGILSRTPSPSVSTLKARFPIFGRRTKPAQDNAQQDKKDKLSTRKGPAAGTGHEGYGRLGSVRRRSGSVTTTRQAIPGTMCSQESLSSSQSRDPFLMERMAPVVIAGGEIIENRNTSSELTRTESNQSFTFSRPSIDSRTSSQISSSSREGPRHSLWPSPFPRGGPSPSLSSRRPSDSSDSEALAMKSTLAFRRSIQRLNSGEQENPRLPKRIVTRPQVVSPSMTSLDTSVMSDDSIFDPSTESMEYNTTAPGVGPKKLMKRARSPRKWNFFGRSHSQPAAETKMADSTKTVAAAVTVVQTKPVAFYTMLDSSEQEDADTLDLGEICREAARSATPPLPPMMAREEERKPSLTQDRASPSPAGLSAFETPSYMPPKRAIPSPIKLYAPFAPRTLPLPAPMSTPAEHPLPPRLPSGRPSRLPQVGRIPKVVSARAEQISPKSFSRPFHRLSVHTPPPKVGIQDADFVAKGPSPPKPSTPDLTQDESTTTSGTNFSPSMYGLSSELPADPGQLGHEFLSFSPRKNSQSTVTTTSSSSGGLLTFAAATAVVPEPNAPLAEDEIWDEYNDLLGDETLRGLRSVRSSSGDPFDLEDYRPDHAIQVEPPLESPTLSAPPLQSMVQMLRTGWDQPASNLYSAEMAEEVRRALDLDQAPSTSIYEPYFATDDGDESRNSVSGKRPDQPEPAQRHSGGVSQPRQSDASGGSSQASEDSSPLSQVNLRVGSMTVSKWLTFGHVLFSPVRDDLIAVVGSLKRPSILVVDGLGNDDWSFYAAETYPAATFFNLSPRAPLPVNHRSSSAFPLSPPNHHQIEYKSHNEKFPFGAQSFTSVVFRFPTASPEADYRNIISEARRVLKPGGFIELSILDVDLNNMGNRGRRAVRRLKERIHARAPDTSLGSTSDLILRLLGRKGFTDIKTCRVGVPVASPIARSSGSEAGNSGKRNSAETGSGRGKSNTRRDNRSLPELISDESPVADENITKMVAKVGRWWYSRCYESAATAAPGSGTRTSLWSDKALLAECEEWGTSFKLMVCHARVPDGRARVASI
ncbi:hypothetical protein B0H63DRAFT_307817 [Podospora didyma]|uniref:Methyltransferase type 11 domain-containing protein n=1 Tax=Podospora didyma TaxID=330526 RepID=A0AAE0K5Q1_9PEZI|nr:hypothetical protein B0H63DRAFT_307817 [Podospora didyma]